jgi:(p)ppGpp synthase/HD superfamily hydrolase
MSVCALVLEHGGDEDEAIAALPHDALEDQSRKTSRRRIARRFGRRVLELITACSDTPPDYEGGEKPPWHLRKERYLQHLREADPGALRIALSDKLYNARQVLADYRVLGEALWSRFNAGKADQLWFYRSTVENARENDASREASRLIEDLDRVVGELEGLAAQAGSAG